MQMPCNSYVDCPQPSSYPLIGYNAETPDVLTFIGTGYGPNTPPPLDWSFQVPTAFATYDSAISQADADQNAYNKAVMFAQAGWVAPGAITPVEDGEPFYGPLTGNVFIEEVGGINEPPLV